MSKQVFDLGQIIKDNLSIIISVISLLVSLFVCFRTVWKERFSIDCTATHWFAAMTDNQPFFIWLSIINKSSMPCSVYKMTIDFKRRDEYVTAESEGHKRLMASSINNDEKRDTYSLDYPIDVDGYKSVGGYVHFVSDFPHYYFEEQSVNLEVYTNRGKQSFTINLTFGDNLFRKMQSQSGQFENIPQMINDHPIEYTKETL